MPKTKFQEFIFTLITSGCMIFIMGVYNVAIHTGGLQAATSKHALHSFPLEWFFGLLCAFFIASKISKYFAFRVAKPTDRPIFIILCIQTICLNFIMAYPLQILVVGPFCRFIFRHLFAFTNQGNESKVENEYVMMNFCFQRKHLWIRFKKSFQFPLVFFIHKSQ